jgi:hypothetical protein
MGANAWMHINIFVRSDLLTVKVTLLERHMNVYTLQVHLPASISLTDSLVVAVVIVGGSELGGVLEVVA